MPTESPATDASSKGAPPKSRRYLLLGFPLLIILGVAAWAGVAAYRNRVMASFEPGCQRALEGKDWKVLEQVARRWSVWQPENADPWIYWAEARQQQGDYDDAAKILENLPPEHPRTIPALLERTTLLFGPLNRPREGVATCRQLLQLNPQQCEARQRLIYYYAQTLQRRKMVEEIHAALEHDCDRPENYVYLIGTDWLSFSNGYSQNNRWLQPDPNDETFLAARAIHFVSSAGLLESDRPLNDSDDESNELEASKGDHREVMMGYLARFPGNIELLTYFLNQEMASGDLNEVARLLGQASEPALEDNRFWRAKGWLHERQQEWEEAESAYQRAIELNPYDWSTRHQLAAVMRRLERFDEVPELEELSSIGKQLRRDLLQLKDARSVPPPMLERMADYAEDCGERQVAQKLRHRIDGLRLLNANPSGA